MLQYSILQHRIIYLIYIINIDASRYENFEYISPTASFLLIHSIYIIGQIQIKIKLMKNAKKA